MGISTPKSEVLKLGHLNTSMWLDFEKSFWDSLSATLAFFLATTPESISAKSDIKETISPIMKKWWDILGFSEIYWEQQLAIVIDELESKWYKCL